MKSSTTHHRPHRAALRRALPARYASLLAALALCAAACDDDDKKPSSMGGAQGGEQGGAQGGVQGGAQGGVQGGAQGGVQGGAQGGEQGGAQGGEQGGVQGGEQGGATPMTFCERYEDTCGAWTGATPCDEWFSAAPAGAAGDTEGATQACYEYHLDAAVADPAVHCAHARGEAVCVPPAPPAPKVAVVYGRFAPLSPAGDAVQGLAQLTRRLEEGVTDAEVYAYGLTPNTAYAVHVHALPCELGAAGPHYKLDPTVAETVEANEVWPAFTTNANGAGRASVRAAGLLRGDAMSVVIHNPADGAKMSCANLTPASGAASFEGTVTPYAAAEAGDQTIAGAATAAVGDAGSEVTLQLTGLDPAAQYNLHVHALPCRVNLAGGHYKVDPTVAEVIESNEVWPALGAIAADGSATATVSTTHRLRSDAQSVVVHRATASGAPKVACADLIRVSYAPVTRPSGALNVLPAAAEQGVGGVMADASLTLALDGSSSVTLNATGLAPNASYNVHLHTDSCAVANGGGHYLIDPAGMAEEANELWPNLSADAAGAASSTVSATAHTLRPEAQSIVVHGDMGARLLCLDLP